MVKNRYKRSKKVRIIQEIDIIFKKQPQRPKNGQKLRKYNTCINGGHFRL